MPKKNYWIRLGRNKVTDLKKFYLTCVLWSDGGSKKKHKKNGNLLPNLLKMMKFEVIVPKPGLQKSFFYYEQ